jgi:hypothetical protein
VTNLHYLSGPGLELGVRKCNRQNSLVCISWEAFLRNYSEKDLGHKIEGIGKSLVSILKGKKGLI